MLHVLSMHCGPKQENMQVRMEHFWYDVLANVGVTQWLRLNFDSMCMWPPGAIGFWKIPGAWVGVLFPHLVNYSMELFPKMSSDGKPKSWSYATNLDSYFLQFERG